MQSPCRELPHLMQASINTSKHETRHMHYIYFFNLILLSCSAPKNIYKLTKNYEPDDLMLYKTIIALDSAFFEAYNHCDVSLEKYSSFYSDSIEFYHDKGGFTNSKQEIIEGTKKNVCGKVTRELIEGSIEVYPIKNYGAIEMGLHRFHNKAEPDSNPKIGRFTVIWKKENSGWKITKVISLH
jgi:ketosteroid isomerase-like protein